MKADDRALEMKLLIAFRCAGVTVGRLLVDGYSFGYIVYERAVWMLPPKLAGA